MPVERLMQYAVRGRSPTVSAVGPEVDMSHCSVEGQSPPGGARRVVSIQPPKSTNVDSTTSEAPVEPPAVISSICLSVPV